MKSIIAALAFVVLLAGPSFAQDAQLQAPAVPPSLATVSGTATDAAPALDWLKIGKPFGKSQLWQFGLDKSPTADACAAWLVNHHEAVVGPCRDLLLLAHKGQRAMHIGGAMYTRPAGPPIYGARLGADIGPAARGVLSWAADKLPAVENLLDWNPPAIVQDIASVTSIDYDPVLINGRVDHGVEAKVSIPLDTLKTLLLPSPK